MIVFSVLFGLYFQKKNHQHENIENNNKKKKKNSVNFVDSAYIFF